MSYPNLMRTRLFDPLGMTDSSVQTTPIVGAGHNATGQPVQPWPMTGYAPAGGVVSTARDLTLLATALLNGRAPGMDALTPIRSRSDGPRLQIGIFWHLNTWHDRRTIVWHDGQTGGYGSLLYLDRHAQRASILLSDVAVSSSMIGNQLLIQA